MDAVTRPGRDAVLALLDEAIRVEACAVAIVRLDRLGRSLGELLTTVQMLRERGIALHIAKNARFVYCRS
jgi:DNA invertase Pin-like site-specific DNA recombinase